MEDNMINNSDSSISKNNAPENIPEEYRPIGMWGYFGYELLFAIPLVGFILLLVFSFGGASNINLRNFARSKFCYWIVIGAIGILITLFIISMGGLAVLSSGILDSYY